jgi:hypothetical protein
VKKPLSGNVRPVHDGTSMSVKRLTVLCGAARIGALATLGGGMTPKLSESAVRRYAADSSVLAE